MNKPTQKELVHFWEWCGLKRGTCGWMYDPADPLKPIFPPLNLISLFQYAVPKLGGYEITFDNENSVCIFLGDESDIRCYESINEDPALALFWVLWEIKNIELKA